RRYAAKRASLGHISTHILSWQFKPGCIAPCGYRRITLSGIDQKDHLRVGSCFQKYTRRSSRMRGLVICGFLLLFLYSLWRGQSTGASLTGRVTDPSHALIVDAKIAAIIDGTNATYETTTNNAGEYYLTNLPPNTYRIEIEKTGFKRLVKSSVVLHVQDALR